MPIHDWTRVKAGLFHHFHQVWAVKIQERLISGTLPDGYFALVEQNMSAPIADILSLSLTTPDDKETSSASNGQGTLAVETVPPQTRIVQSNEAEVYAARASRIVLRHDLGKVVAVIEIVSPGNKGSQHGLQTFIQRNLEILNQGIHLLVIDLFPPSTRDPQGIHKALWDEIVENDFELPPDLPLTMVSYDAGPPLVAYIEPVAIGGELPKMPLFLEAGQYVELLMEETYLAAWNLTPSPVQELLT